MRRTSRLLLLASVAVVAIAIPITALAHGGRDRLRAEPWVFVGTASQCAPGPAGSRIVTSGWLSGMGLPDNGGDTALNGVPATRRDAHRGLLLNKNGLTSDCSSAGAEIKGVRGALIADPAAFVVGYDYRDGGHCGGGAPRFNVTVRTPSGDEWTYFVGCNTSVQTPAPQDAQWIRSRSTLATATPQLGDPPQPPAIPPNSRIVALDIVFDEGTDQGNVSDPNGVGLAVIDNIFVNGKYIRTGSGVEPDGWDRDHDDDD
ncbi:MAG TPA: hypothetical protein VH723_03535 [Candidatus Limnocylindrales bacterium]|jgi:hypothetical protein